MSTNARKFRLALTTLTLLVVVLAMGGGSVWAGLFGLDRNSSDVVLNPGSLDTAGGDFVTTAPWDVNTGFQISLMGEVESPANAEWDFNHYNPGTGGYDWDNYNTADYDYYHLEIDSTGSIPASFYYSGTTGEMLEWALYYTDSTLAVQTVFGGEIVNPSIDGAGTFRAFLRITPAATYRTFNGDGEGLPNTVEIWGGEGKLTDLLGYEIEQAGGFSSPIWTASGNVTLQAVLAGGSLSLDPCGGWVEDGQQVTVDVMMSGSGFNGVEFDLTYDHTLLQVDSVVKGSMWDGYNTNVMQAGGSGGTIEFAAFLQEQDTTLDVTQAQVATITFTGLADGESALTFANTILSNPDGEELGISLEAGCTLTVHGHGSVEGDVELQGRFVAGGSLERHADASVKITGGPGGGFEYNGSTDANGHWEITGVIEGDYDVEVEMDRYLDAQRSTSGQVTLSAGGSVDAGFVKLLGGDCNDDIVHTAVVDSLDASIVGSQFGNSDGGITDARADINDDYKVNILDCAILGGNYGKVGPLAW